MEMSAASETRPSSPAMRRPQPHCGPRSAWRSALRPTAVLVALAAIALVSCGGESGRNALAEAGDAYAQAAYGRAVECARRAAASASGIELDRARYIEGLGEWKLGRLPQGAKLLAQVGQSDDRALAADALVSLGSLEIERDEFDAAGRAYEKAAECLEGTERRRAYGVAMRCYERAGLLVESERLRTRAGLPPSDAQVAAARDADAARADTGDVRPQQAPSTRAPSTEEVSGRNGIAKQTPAPQPRFAIQAGAFSQESRARAVAAEVATRAKGTSLGAPRVIEKQSGTRRVFVVQIGGFANRIEAGKAMAPFSKMTFTVEPYLE